MKILYDYQCFYMQQFGGISNMYANIIANFPKDVEWTIGLKDCNNIHLAQSGLMQTKSIKTLDTFLWQTQFRGKARLFHWANRFFPQYYNSFARNQQLSIDLLKSGDFDIFHPTFFSDYFLDYLHGKPYVLTIYDMISELFFEKDNMQNLSKKKMVQSAAHIVAISEKTKEDIVNILKVPEEKISVVYLATNNIKNENHEPIVQGNYLLYVGNRNLYKNFLPMVKSLAPVLHRHQELRLVCTGHDLEKDELEVIRNEKIADQIVHLSPSDIELRNLYTNAMAFIYPSLYEGFGIPILEAWQCDCPVLLNQKSCFPEIAQDAATYFTLDNENDNLSQVVEEFLQISPKDRQHLIERQQKRLSYFTWKKSAEQMYHVYQKIMQ